MAVIQAHFFASFNLFPAMSPSVPIAMNMTEYMIFSFNEFVFDWLKKAKGTRARKMSDSTQISIEQYLIPEFGGCLNSFILS